MRSPARRTLAAARIALAVLVCAVAVVTVTDLPRPYPTWPTVGPVPVDPELVVPGVLGLLAVLEPVTEGVDPGSLITGVLGAGTLWLASTSLYQLYAAEAGGVFWGGFFTLGAGVVLAAATLLRSAARANRRRRFALRVRDRFDR